MRTIDSLEGAGLFSEYGRETIRKEVASGGRFLVLTPQRGYYPEGKDSLSAGQLLGILYRTYQSAYIYRLGLTAEQEVVKQWQQRPDFNTDMLYTRAFRAAVERRRLSIPGYQYEQQRLEAVNGDKEVNWAEWSAQLTVTDHSIDFKDKLVPANRSVFGPDVQITLQSVYESGLIGRDTFEHYRQELETEGIYPDYLLLRKLAEGAGTRESERKRIGDRRFAIRFLGDRGVIAEERVPSLLKDSLLLTTLDDRVLYEYVRPRIELEFRQPSGLEELAGQFHRQLCSFDPQLCKVTVKVVADGNGTSATRSRYWLVGSNEDWESAPSTEIYSYSEADELPWYHAYDGEVFLQPYNAYLASIDAPYRLYTLPLLAPGADGVIRLPVFPLTSGAARAIDSPSLRDAMENLRGPETSTFMSTDEAYEILDSLAGLGLLSSLEGGISTARECVREKTLRGIYDLFLCLPGLYSRVARGGDSEGNNGLRSLSDLRGEYFMLAAEAYDQPNLLVKLERPVVTFLEGRFPFALDPVD